MPYVDATPAREHLDALSVAGIGRRHVAELTGIASSQLAKIRSGQTKRVRRPTLAKILDVPLDAHADHALIDAAATWRLIEELLDAGITRRRIGQAITGRESTVSLQLRRRRITRSSADAVAALHRELVPPLPYRCSCGLPLAGLDDWRAHNDGLAGRVKGHRLGVAS